MSSAKCNYEIHDKEMLAIVKSFAQWRPELEETHSRFQIFTDHKALKYFITIKQLTERQARWVEALSKFYFTIMYRSGKQNEKADALTRQEQKVGLQNTIKTEYQTWAFLNKDQIDPQVFQNLEIDVHKIDLSSIKKEQMNESLGVINQILQVNRNAESLHVTLATSRGQSALHSPLPEAFASSSLFDNDLVVDHTSNPWLGFTR